MVDYEQDKDLRPWDRQRIQPSGRWETKASYDVFWMYIRQENRSLAKIAEKLNRRVNTLYEWSSRYNWQERVAAWDADQEAETRREIEVEIKDRKRERANIARNLIALVGARAARLVQRVNDGDPAAVDELALASLAPLFKVASEVQREALGEPDQRVDITVRPEEGFRWPDGVVRAAIPLETDEELADHHGVVTVSGTEEAPPDDSAPAPAAGDAPEEYYPADSDDDDEGPFAAAY